MMAGNDLIEHQPANYKLCFLSEENLFSLIVDLNKGLVKLLKQVKIAHTFLRSVSNQFHVIILSLPM